MISFYFFSVSTTICFSCTASSCDLWPHCSTNGYHENIADYQPHTNRGPNNGYGANLSDSVPNLSLNMCGVSKQSISHGDLVHGERCLGRSISIDNGERRTPALARHKSVSSKPPIYEKPNRNGPLLLLEDREMPITRDRHVNNAPVNGHMGSGVNRFAKNGSPSMLRASGNHTKYGLSSDRLRVR